MKIEWSLGDQKEEAATVAEPWPSPPAGQLNVRAGEVWTLAMTIGRLAAAMGLVLVVVCLMLQSRSDVGPDTSLQAPSFVKRATSTLEDQAGDEAQMTVGVKDLAWTGGNSAIATSDDRSTAVSPKAFCEALSEAGFVNGGWSKSPVFKGEWECFSSNTTTLKSQANGESFVMARGRDETIIGTVLLKITLGSVYQQEAAGNDIRKLLRLVSQGFGMEFQSEVVDHIAEWKNVKTQTGSARLEFRKEFSGQSRYSLSIAFVPNTAASKAHTSGPNP